MTLFDRAKRYAEELTGQQVTDEEAEEAVESNTPLNISGDSDSGQQDSTQSDTADAGDDSGSSGSALDTAQNIAENTLGQDVSDEEAKEAVESNTPLDVTTDTEQTTQSDTTTETSEPPEPTTETSASFQDSGTDQTSGTDDFTPYSEREVRTDYLSEAESRQELRQRTAEEFQYLTKHLRLTASKRWVHCRNGIWS